MKKLIVIASIFVIAAILTTGIVLTLQKNNEPVKSQSTSNVQTNSKESEKPTQQISNQVTTATTTSEIKDYEDQYVKLKYPANWTPKLIQREDKSIGGVQFNNGKYTLSFQYNSFLTTGAGYGYFGDSDGAVQLCESEYVGDRANGYNPLPKMSSKDKYYAVTKYIDTTKCQKGLMKDFDGFTGEGAIRYGGSLVLIDVTTFPNVKVTNQEDQMMKVRYEYNDFYKNDPTNYKSLINTFPVKGSKDLVDNLKQMDSILYSLSFKTTPPINGQAY